MKSTYEPMWESLGLDLQAHGELLQTLGKFYTEIFLAQQNRPEGMKYLDFVMSEVHGLRVKELLDGKEQGHAVVGAFCVFVPEEIVRAAGATMVGLCTGAEFATEEAERLLPRNTCALIKSAFGFKLGKVCPYIEACDLIVGENTCDGKKKSYEQLGKLLGKLYVMDLPQMKTEQGRALLKSEYLRFMDRMETLTGNTIDAEALRRGISITNRKRSAVHRLNSLRAADPAPISGLDALLVNQVFFYDEPGRFSDSVEKIADEVEARLGKGEGVFPKGTPRILMSGCPMAVPNWKVPWIVETSGAVIVGEESCVGERGTRNLTPDNNGSIDAVLENIVNRYFNIDCAIFTPNEDRLNHIVKMYEQYHATGVIHYSLQFCQPYQIESMSVEAELEERGIPVLRLETDYSMEDVEQLRTRIQAFIERIS